MSDAGTGAALHPPAAPRGHGSGRRPMRIGGRVRPTLHPPRRARRPLLSVVQGGSTSLQNFVAACARCNRAKRARIPSPGQQQRLERRRRDYVTSGALVSVGERQPLR
ncbi:HNH endonuclease [Arthrobacter nitrophenolicus]|uniref:HNH endonuclease n=1 Tax=Arthrobacter nitrophenolicus TaxID=683150 RepID=UPI003B8A8078